MYINVSNLKYELDIIKKQLESFENNSYNLYNEINNIKFAWNCNKCDNFLNVVSNGKINFQNNYNNLNYLVSIYDFMINRYESIGNKIVYNSINENKVYNNLDNYILKIDNIILLYNSMISQNTIVSSALKVQLDKFVEIKANIINLKSNLKTITNDINQIEMQILQMLQSNK